MSLSALTSKETARAAYWIEDGALQSVALADHEKQTYRARAPLLEVQGFALGISEP